MNQADLTVDGKKYLIGKLPPLDQFHVGRRLTPIMAGIGISLHALSDNADKEVDFAAIAGPVADIMAKMTDEEANYIIFKCLNVVKRVDGTSGAAAPVATASGHMMYDDIEMPTMIRLVVEVVRFSMGNFMRGLLDGTTTPPA